MGRHVLPLSAGLAVAAPLIDRPLAPPGPAAPNPSSVNTRGSDGVRGNRGGRRGSPLDASRGTELDPTGGDSPQCRSGTFKNRRRWCLSRESNCVLYIWGVDAGVAVHFGIQSIVRPCFAAAWRTADGQI